MWLEVAASFDRFLTIVFLPTRFKSIQKPIVQQTILALILIYNLLFYSEILINYTNSSSQIEWANTLNLMEFVSTSVVPFLVMLTLTIATLYGVLRAHLRMKSAETNNSYHRTLRRDVKFGVTMIVLNVLFFVFNVLYRVHTVVGISPFSAQKQSFSFLVFGSILAALPEVYYSINLYVQLAVNSLLRHQLNALVHTVWTFLIKIFFI